MCGPGSQHDMRPFLQFKDHPLGYLDLDFDHVTSKQSPMRV